MEYIMFVPIGVFLVLIIITALGSGEDYKRYTGKGPSVRPKKDT